ncbi:MAG: ribosome silencing factor [Gammaproteobacteria bacterium]|nr:ribosome silencing factor [Gammaproteobacteria bacterium]
MQSKELLDLAVAALEDMKARDVCVLDVATLTSITDYMIVAGGTSDRHVRAIADSLVEAIKEAGERPLGIEGMDAGEWVLVDLQDVVVHIMQASTREFYKLEKLWDMGSNGAGAGTGSA